MRRWVRVIVAALAVSSGLIASEMDGLILDLDATRGVVVEDGDRVSKWQNQVPDFAAREFVKRDEGRKEMGSGRPRLRASVPELGGAASVVFAQQELVCLEEDAFDGLSCGKGCTWVAVLAVHDQRVGLKDVNSFFGNLRNGGKYEGIWGNVGDDNRLWWGPRNGLTFGRFDVNNPRLDGPILERGKFHLIAGRLGAGTGMVSAELFVGTMTPVSRAPFPVNPQGNPSRMAIGQERDAVNHPGHESFDGEIARFCLYDRPLGDEEMTRFFNILKGRYFGGTHRVE